MPTTPNRSIVYIDGFNLYYGALKGTPHKWLDLERYCRMIRPDDDIQRIYYFTALIVGPSRPKQETYLQALETRPLINVVLGRFKTRQVTCRVPTCRFPQSRIFQAPEEKETDVNIALQMVDDAYQDFCDRIVLISGDSDLVPALRLIKARFPQKTVSVYIPTRNQVRGAATQIRMAADKHRELPLAPLAKAQFPPQVPTPFQILAKPSGW